MTTKQTDLTTQAAAAPPATKPKGQYAEIKDLLTSEGFKRELAVALPKHMTADRFLRVVLTSVRKNPKLMQCSRESFFASLLLVAQLGLEPDDPRGLSSLVPFNRRVKSPDGPDVWVSECSVIIGYRGYIDLARRSGEISNIQAATVFERDVFEYELGLEPRLRHIPYNGTDDPGRITNAYAIAFFKDGAKQFVVLPVRDIERARAVSKEGGKGRGPWQDWYPEMAMKTAVRRLAKFLPQSPEMALAQAVDDADTLRVQKSPEGLVFDVAASVNDLPGPDDVQMIEQEGEPIAEGGAAQASTLAEKLAKKAAEAKA